MHIRHAFSTHAAWVASGAVIGLLGLGPSAFGPSAAWSTEGGFCGGLAVANLGGDSDAFRLELEEGLEDEIGGDWTSSAGARSGAAIGGFLAFPISPYVAFQPEFHYIPRGAEYHFHGSVPGFGTLDLTEQLRFSYFEIPVLFRVTPAPGRVVSPVLVFGPSIGLSLGASLQASSALGPSTSADISELMKAVSIGAVVGAGMEVAVSGATSFVVQGRYTMGLSNLVDDPELMLTARDFTFLAGMTFYSSD